MKWRCRNSRRLIVLAVYGDLTEAEQARLAAHLSQCPECAAFQSACEALIRSIPQDPSRAAGDEPSPGFAARLSAALGQEMAGGKVRQVPAVRAVVRPRRYALAGGLAALLVLGGMFIGRYFLPGPQPRTTSAAAGSTSDRELVEQIGRTREYLDKTRTLLLGIVNARQVMPGAETPDLRKEQEVSWALSSEGRVIRGTLRGDDEELQRRLIDEIDVLLIQLATLEERHGQRGIEVVRREVEQRGLLLKINLADLQMASREQRLAARGVK